MIPAPQDISIRRGDTFRLFFRLRKKNADGTPGDYQNLDTWGAGLAQIRAGVDGALIVALVVTKANQVNYPGGVLLTIADDVTATLEIPSGAKWDFEIENDLGEVDTYLAGDVTFTKDVSKVGP
jgi:hypothetical protein